MAKQLTATEKLAKLRKQRDEVMGTNTPSTEQMEDRLRNVELEQVGDHLVITVDLSSPWGEEYTARKGRMKGRKCFAIKHADCTSFGRPLDLGDKWLTLRVTDKQPSE